MTASPTQRCSKCGSAIPGGATFCTHCGTRLVAGTQSASMAPARANPNANGVAMLNNVVRLLPGGMQAPKRFLPLLARVLGVFFGWFAGPLVGFVLGIVGPAAISYFLLGRRSFLPKPNALPRYVSKMATVAGYTLVMMLFMAPVASAWPFLMLPDIHNPDTFMKYLSIVAIRPGNLLMASPKFSPAWSPFPGLPLLVLPALLLLVVGGLFRQFGTVQRRIAMQAVGLAILGIAPTITATLVGVRTPVPFVYSSVYYLAWVGVGLQAGADYLPRLLPPSAGGTGPQVRSFAIVPLLPILSLPLILSGLHIDVMHIEVWRTFLSVDLAHLRDLLTTLAPGDFESEHHLAAGAFSAGFSGVLAGDVTSDVEDDGDEPEEEAPPPAPPILELTYPVGRSPKVFVNGWVFGARCILRPGTDQELDVSDQVQWSGTGTFYPQMGERARPTFQAAGANTITLTYEEAERKIVRNFDVEAVATTGYVYVGCKSQVPADVHGCPACPHDCVGPLTSGSPLVQINGEPAGRVGDTGTHASCCGPNTWTVRTGDPEVVIDGRHAAYADSEIEHCGGDGYMLEWDGGSRDAVKAEAPTPPLDSGLRDPDSGEMVAAWEPGKYEGGKTGDVWYDGRWQPAAEAQAQIQSTLDRKAEQDAKNQSDLDAFRARNKELDQESHAKQQQTDADARAARDARDNAVGVARAEAKIAVQKTIQSGMDRNAAQAEHFKQSANTADLGATVSETIVKTADTSIGILSNLTGEPGELINDTYSATKTFAGKFAEGLTEKGLSLQGIKDSAKDAAKETVAGIIVDKISGKLTDKIIKTTGLPLSTKDVGDASVTMKTFFKGIKPRTWTANAPMKWALGERVKKPIDLGFQQMGWKAKDE